MAKPYRLGFRVWGSRVCGSGIGLRGCGFELESRIAGKKLAAAACAKTGRAAVEDDEKQHDSPQQRVDSAHDGEDEHPAASDRVGVLFCWSLRLMI